MTRTFLRQILLITAFRLLLNTGRRFVYPFAPALSRGLEVPLGAITSIIAAGQFTSLLGIFAGPLADRYGYRMMMRAGLAMLALGMLANPYLIVMDEPTNHLDLPSIEALERAGARCTDRGTGTQARAGALDSKP